jgi:hypothetical protein
LVGEGYDGRVLGDGEGDGDGSGCVVRIFVIGEGEGEGGVELRELGLFLGWKS